MRMGASVSRQAAANLPSYAQPDNRAALLSAGASGTIYALVMPESEMALQHVVDGCDRKSLDGAPDALSLLDQARRDRWFSRFHEPWTQKQDEAHVEYLDGWLRWAAPVLRIDRAAFPHRYPTAGASEGIFKLMAEYSTSALEGGTAPTIHVFDGEYEGFAALAASLRIRVVRHRRDAWADAPGAIEPGGQFWISQPSAIDGAVWTDFEAFVGTMAAVRPDVSIVPDLTYVGAVAREYLIPLDFDNVPAFVISHSKPFGGYYHRAGGVYARRHRPSLFGNRWFKNLTSLAWGIEMMSRYGVFDLPRRYAPIQAAAAHEVGRRLGVADLRAADVFLLGVAAPPLDPAPALASAIRGAGADRVLRLCLTPTMAAMAHPSSAPDMVARLAKGRPLA